MDSRRRIKGRLDPTWNKEEEKERGRGRGRGSKVKVKVKVKVLAHLVDPWTLSVDS